MTSDVVAARKDVNADGRHMRRAWIIVTSLLVAAYFAEAIFAGAILSGVAWASKAHALNAVILTASTIIAGLVCILTLRRMRHGLRLGLTLLALGLVVILQAALGALSAKGANFMWLHVPLGVALVGLATQALAGARRLGDDSR